MDLLDLAIHQERAGCCFYTTLKILLCVFASLRSVSLIPTFILKRAKHPASNSESHSRESHRA